MNQSAATKRKNDALNGVLAIMWKLPEQERFFVFSALFSALAFEWKEDAIDLAGRCCAVHQTMGAKLQSMRVS